MQINYTSNSNFLSILRQNYHKRRHYQEIGASPLDKEAQSHLIKIEVPVAIKIS